MAKEMAKKRGVQTVTNQGDTQEQRIQMIAGALSALLVGKVDKNGQLSAEIGTDAKGNGLFDFIANGNAFFTEATENFKSVSDNLEEVSKAVIENSQIRKNDTTLKEIFSSSNTFYTQLLSSISGIQETLANSNSKDSLSDDKNDKSGQLIAEIGTYAKENGLFDFIANGNVFFTEATENFKSIKDIIATNDTIGKQDIKNTEELLKNQQKSSNTFYEALLSSVRNIESFFDSLKNETNNTNSSTPNNVVKNDNTSLSGIPDLTGARSLLSMLDHGIIPDDIDKHVEQANAQLIAYTTFFSKIDENLGTFIDVISNIASDKKVDETKLKALNQLFLFTNNIISLIEKLTSAKLLGRLLILSVSLDSFTYAIRKKFMPGLLQLQDILKNDKNGDLLKIYSDIANRLDILGDVMKGVTSIFTSFSEIAQLDIDDVVDSIEGMKKLFSNDGKLSELRDCIVEFLEKINNDSEIAAASKDFSETLKNLFYILSFKDKNINDVYAAVDFMKELTEEYGNFFEDLKESVFGEESLSTLESIQNNTEKLKEVLDGYVDLLQNFGTMSMLNSLIGLSFAVTSVDAIKELLNSISGIQVDEISLNNFNKILSKRINPIIGNLMKINKYSIKDLMAASMKMLIVTTLFKNSNKAISTLASKIGSINIEDLAEGLSKFADVLQTTVKKFNKINLSKLKDAMNILDRFEKLIIKLSLILIIAAAAAAIVNIGGVFVMAASLSMLLLSVGGTMVLFSKISDNALDAADSAMKLVMVSGLILAIASLVMSDLGDAVNILAFGVVLGLFLWGISKVFEEIAEGKAFKKTLKGAKDAMMLVALSAAILLAGSMIYHFIPMTDVIGFGALLSGFIFLLSLAYLPFILGGDTIFEGAEGFGKLVALSGATLLLGALIYRFVPFTDVLGFEILLASFIFAITAAYALAASIANRKTLTLSEQLAKVIAVSGAVLLAAGLIMGLRDDMYKDVMLFALTLGLFISGISLAMGLAAKISRGKTFAALATISTVTLVVGGLLLFAGYLIGKDPNMLANITKFGIGVLLFVGINALIIWGLSNIGIGKLLVATLALVGIGVLALLMGETMKILSDVANQTDFDKLDKLLLRMALVFGSLLTVVAGVAAAFGMLGSSGLGWLAIGGAVIGIAVAEAAIYGIIKLVDLAAETMKHLAEAAEAMDSIKGLDFSTIGDSLGLFITAIRNAVDKLDEGGTWFERHMGGLGKAINAGGYAAKFGAISTMAAGVKSIALSIKEWSDAFPEGMDSKKVGAIGSTLIAIIQSFTEPLKDPKVKSMFDVDIWTGKSPINTMMKAYKEIGKVLESIGKGVQFWASLKVPIYNADGSLKTYITLTTGDLTEASNNIKKIIIAIGTGLAEAADSDVFKTSVVDKESKAVQAAKAIGIVSESLSTIAMSLVAYAKGEFPVLEYIDGKLNTVGKPVTIDNDEMTAAKERIKTIITGLAEAIKAASTSLQGRYNITQVATSIKDSSEALANIVGVINDIAALETNGVSLDKTQSYFETTLTSLFNLISIFDEDSGKDRNGFWGWIVDGLSGKRSKSEYITSVVDDIKELTKATQTLASQLSIFINAIKDIVKPFYENRDAFDILNGKDSEINQMVIKAMESLGDPNEGILSVLSSYINPITRMINILNIGGGFGNRRLSNTFDKIKDTLIDFMKAMISIKSEFSAFSSEDFRTINTIFDTYNKMLETMSLTKKFDRTLDKQSLVNSIEILSDITELMKNADQTPSKGLMTLGTNMASLSMALDALPDDKTLAKSKKVLKEYVKEFDNIDVSKISTFINLVNSLDNLAMRLGSLDSFTDSFAAKIMNVLSDLTTQLTEAKDTINNAHSLDENRKKLIQNSISEIRKMMSDDIIVKISADENNNTVTRTGFTDTGGSAGGNRSTSAPNYWGSSNEGGSSTQVALSPEYGRSSGNGNSIDDLITQIKALIDTLSKNQKQDR